MCLIGCNSDPAQEAISGSAGERKKVISKLTDEAILSRVAIQDQNPLIGEAAVARLSDPTLLALVAMKRSDQEGASSPCHD
jgi:hypothetical protein